MGNKGAYIHLRGSDLKPEFHQFTAVVSIFTLDMFDLDVGYCFIFVKFYDSDLLGTFIFPRKAVMKHTKNTQDLEYSKTLHYILSYVSICIASCCDVSRCSCDDSAFWLFEGVIVSELTYLDYF